VLAGVRVRAEEQGFVVPAVMVPAVVVPAEDRLNGRGRAEQSSARNDECSRVGVACAVVAEGRHRMCVQRSLEEQSPVQKGRSSVDSTLHSGEVGTHSDPSCVRKIAVSIETKETHPRCEDDIHQFTLLYHRSALEVICVDVLA
jgi:hypothetical protein